MEKNNPSILVVGAGAVGGITAALLKRSGFDVEIVCRNREYAKRISDVGFHISGTCGVFTQKVKAWAFISDVKEKKDIVLLATKATEMIDAARDLLQVLKPDGCIVSLQNGFCEDDLASVIGKERVIGCVVGWGATMENPGELLMSSGGDFIIGYTDRVCDEQLKTISSILSAVVPVRMTNNITGHLYSKLIINSCITSLGALCGLYLGEMLSDQKVRNIFIEIIREAVAVSEKMGIRIEVFGGKLDFNKFIEKDNFLANIRRHVMIRIIGFRYRRLKSSSLQSLSRGRPTEIDYLNGYIVRNGIESGVEVPVNSAIVRIIHEIESGSRKISTENFNEPEFDRF
jgi:2-dehydropantoate 2-reductase